MLLIALRDVKTGSFMPPMVASTPGEAERIYQECLAGAAGAMVKKYPHDFPLYEVGSYDDKQGLVTPLLSEDGKVQPPRLLLEAAQLLKPVELAREEVAR